MHLSNASVVSRTTDDDRRGGFHPHRARGLIDGHQWLLLAVGHNRRHLEQINEVKRIHSIPARKRNAHASCHI